MTLSRHERHIGQREVGRRHIRRQRQQATLGCAITLRENQAVVRQKLQGSVTAALQEL